MSFLFQISVFSSNFALKRKFRNLSFSEQKCTENKKVIKNRYAISSESDTCIKRGARVHARHRNIPDENRFHFKKNIYIDKNKSIEMPDYDCNNKYKEKEYFGKPISIKDNILEKIDLEGRLDLHAHGDEDHFSGLSAKNLAEVLWNAGLRNVGILKLQSCDAGKKDFLSDLKRALQDKGINFGYISGPKGSLVELRREAKIFNYEFNFHPFRFLGYSNKQIDNAAEKHGLVVVKGNIDIVFPGTRYNLPS